MKKVLLIAGGGTLGYYTASELLRLGHCVDIICPEDKVSDNSQLRYFKALGTHEFLTELFAREKYDGIVNFIHYKQVDEYKKIHSLLIKNTSHLIFLSSYRVYAGCECPIREDSPRIYDTTDNAKFFTEEDYANPKSQAEDFLVNECSGEPWTIVRPVISFSMHRFDIFTYSGTSVLDNDILCMPESARAHHAGIDWAGNSGKLIANVLFNQKAYGECYTVSSAQNLTWGEVAQLYTELAGTEFKWIEKEEWLRHEEYIQNSYWAAVYDRFYDRKIENRKVLEATGLKKEDFKSIKEGLKIEIAKAKLLEA